ncbi:MAG: metallophosphoesterase family protein [Thermoproteus sp.]
MDLRQLFADARRKFEEGGLVLDVEEDKLVIVGDLHGDKETLDLVLKRWDGGKFLFLGDYVDRGDKGLEVLTTVVRLYLEGKAYVLRGNHESPLMNEDGGFMEELCLYKRIPNCGELYGDIERMFAAMPVAARINGAVLAVHGGIPLKEPSMEPASIAELAKPSGDLVLPEDPLVYQALWNDPCDCEAHAPSPRGPGIWLYGRGPTERFLKGEGLKAIVRGHLYVSAGYVSHHGVVHTVFTSRAGPYKAVRPKVAVLDGGELQIYDLLSNEAIRRVEI